MEIVKAEQLPLTEITALGKVFAESGLFADVKSQAQAVVRILAGQEIGIPAFAAISGIHIIQGKPTIGAGLMASRVKGSGKYDYIVKEHDDKKCSIDFLQAGKTIGNSTFTIDDAKKAGTKNLDKFPRNMLFARAMSNGVKWYTPDIFAGPVYVPEEMQITEDVNAEITDGAKGTGSKAKVDKWAATPEQWEEANNLLSTANLDDNRKASATNQLANAINATTWNSLIESLRKVQPAA